MRRILIGIFAGAFAALACIFAIESFAAALYPLPAGVDPHSSAGSANMVAHMALPAKLLVTFAWCAGTLLGGAIAARLTHRPVAAWLIAAFVVADAFATIARITKPGWMVGAALILPCLCTLAILRFARRAPR